jgi:hypothetical protein
MHDMMQRLLLDGQDLSYPFHHHSSTGFDDDVHDRRHRRRSSVTDYELNSFQNKPLPKSKTSITNRLSTTKPDQIRFRRPSNQLQRRSTIQRLNSTTSNDSNNVPIQSNEYTSITDGEKKRIYFFFNFFVFLVIDVAHHEWQPSSPILLRPSKIDDNSMTLLESTKEETSGYEAEEQTHNLLGEIIRKRVRKSSLNRPNISAEPYCDSDRVSLLSVDINTSSSNLNLSIPDAKL